MPPAGADSSGAEYCTLVGWTAGSSTTTCTCMTYFTKSWAMPSIIWPNISKPSRCHSTSGSF